MLNISKRVVCNKKKMIFRKASVLCSEPIGESCVNILKDRGHTVETSSAVLSNSDLWTKIGDFDGLIVRSKSNIDKELLEHAKNGALKIIGRAGTGTDNIDVLQATKRGILVMNTAGVNAGSAAELTLGLMMASLRKLPKVVDGMKNGHVDGELGTGLYGKTVGIVGLGRIGRLVAEKCNGFGMKVIGYDVLLSDAASSGMGIEAGSLDEVFARSDVISLHLPYQRDTRNIVNQQRLATCKDGVHIVNCARSGLIDYDAALQALQCGKMSGLAMDFHTKPNDVDQNIWEKLKKMENVIMTPHIGALTVDAQERVATGIGHQMADALELKAFQGVVNAPNVDFATKSESLPYLSLAQKLGSLHAQLLGDNRLKRIVITSQGEQIGRPDTAEAVVNAVLRGLLSFMLEEEVQFGNAREIAQTMGIRFEEHRHKYTHDGMYTNELEVSFEMESGESRNIAGTVLRESDIRLIRYNDMRIDVIPSGTMILFKNTDKPGVLGEITQLLAEKKVNIASFSLGRNDVGGNAIGILKLDEAVDDHIIDELSKIQALTDVRPVNLLELPFVRGFKNFKKYKSQDASPVYVADGTNTRPSDRPSSPAFGSGPCKKRPGYSLAQLPTDCLGRSHRSVLGKGRIVDAIDSTKRLLGIPKDYHLGIVPASDTGAFEMAMWNLLGERPVDMCHWESFGKGWYSDVTKELKLTNVTEYTAPYGELPDLTATNSNHDVCFTWNGTTSGVRVPNADWISDDRQGLVFNDATSAAFSMDMPWNKLDVVTFSWQKALGGEGAHGMLVLSPRAVERLESFDSGRPMPKIFRLKKSDGSFLKGVFAGNTINTPSMLCVEDYLDALRWSESQGGLEALINRSNRNLAVLERFAEENNWIHFLAKDKSIRSSTSVCLLVDLPKEQIKKMIDLLADEEIAYDIGSYRDAPAGLRIWCGATVEESDLEKLCPWLRWAYQQVKE